MFTATADGLAVVKLMLYILHVIWEKVNISDTECQTLTWQRYRTTPDIYRESMRELTPDIYREGMRELTPDIYREGMRELTAEFTQNQCNKVVVRDISKAMWHVDPPLQNQVKDIVELNLQGHRWYSGRKVTIAF